MGVLTIVDRAALAAYCQAYGRWVEAEQKLAETPLMLKTPSGYVQQSPWLSVSNKQLELMGRYMGELGITPSSRSRVAAAPGFSANISLQAMLEASRGRVPPTVIEIVGRDTDCVCSDQQGNVVEGTATLPPDDADP